MEAKILRLFFCAIFIGMIGSILLTSGSTLAHHYDYLQQNTNHQSTMFTGPDATRSFRTNFNFHRWALGHDGAHWDSEAELASSAGDAIRSAD